tara:strand:+ start:1625 stop:1915 length:291 start_codon:yes stop_codon:yes gene_type:complete
MAGSTESNARMQSMVDQHGPNTPCPEGYRRSKSGDCVKINIDPGFDRGPSADEINKIDPFFSKGPNAKTLRNIDPGFYKGTPDTINQPDWLKNFKP